PGIASPQPCLHIVRWIRSRLSVLRWRWIRSRLAVLRRRWIRSRLAILRWLSIGSRLGVGRIISTAITQLLLLRVYILGSVGILIRHALSSSFFPKHSK